MTLDRLWRRIAELIDEVIEDFEDEIEREIRRATRWLRDWTAGLGSAGGAIGIASPFADVMTTPDEVRVVVELPGAEKEKIRVWATEGRLTVEAEGPDRRYYKELWLPCEVDPKGARSTYRNGVLEVRLPRKSKGEPIRVD